MMLAADERVEIEETEDIVVDPEGLTNVSKPDVWKKT